MYNISDKNKTAAPVSTWLGLRRLFTVMGREQYKLLILAVIAILINSALTLSGPALIGYTIDHYIKTRQFDGVLFFAGILLLMYFIAFVASYLQTQWMGKVGLRLLYNLRNIIFDKLQSLPVDFFNQNKAGDLISRVNNDSDKISQFFSQSLVQFVGNLFVMIGAGIFLVCLNWKLGLAALLPAALLWILTKALSPWVKRKNASSLKSTGGLSAEIQESLHNFKVIIAFNRRDYFRRRFDEANQSNFKAAVGAGIANNTFTPFYGLLANLGQLVVLVFGIYLITSGEFTVGLLISFLAYVFNFYTPLRHLAVMWANFQAAMAGWDRISQILALENNLPISPDLSDKETTAQQALLSFHNVSFSYPSGKMVLENINFDLYQGKTYAFVGPTGGGKTTTASLMARLYDPSEGTVYLNGKDLRSYSPAERAQKIGFILQEPFLFSGTVRDNILYGNQEFQHFTADQLQSVIHEMGLESLLERFEQGLETTINTSGDAMSLGQKQLVAFMRAVLRKPDLLILDEATANIDTLTEQLLESILQHLPSTTTRVIIAHRLNTIENADEIFFVNANTVEQAGSLTHAVDMLLHNKRNS